MPVTDAQVRKLMKEYQKHGEVGQAALKAGMHRNTARKYLAEGRLPSDLKKPRHWRTRENPFEKDWSRITELLREQPELETKTIFDLLLAEEPDGYQEGQLRTLQRHVRQWRAENGPPKEIFFDQAHRPGEALQTDFTSGNGLGVTIAGDTFPHLLCHPVLPYSNWEWVTVCRSESLLALTRGIQGGLVELGQSPEYSQTDQSTAATHKLGRTAEGGRGFNEEYEEFVRHYSMKPRTIGVGKKEQNGDVESSHNALKKRIRQQLLLRGSRDFETVDAYEKWLQDLVRRVNKSRRARLGEELAVMRPIPTTRVREFNVVKTEVKRGSVIRVKGNVYSVPARLRGELVTVRVYEDRIEVYFAGKVQLRTERLVGKGHARIDYRHVIASLVRKPGAFERYRYRQELFPTLVFRRAYDHIAETEKGRSQRQIDLEYLRLLELAASVSETKVETVVAQILESGEGLKAAAVRAQVKPSAPATVDVDVPPVDLSAYDDLLEAVAS